MRLLLINKFLRPVGGAETVFFHQWRWLEEAGHEVIPFGVAHPDNVPSPYASFWVPPVDYERPTIGQLGDLIWSRTASARLQRLVRETRPEVALLHNIYHQLSPSILPILRDAGIPALMVVHDYKLICPNYRLYTKGAFCTRCVAGHAWHAVRHRCQQDSLGASLVVAAETSLHRRLRAYRGIQLLLAPSRFLHAMLRRGGWPHNQIAHLPHATPTPPAESLGGERHGVLFVGRLTAEKGGDTLLDAAIRLPDIPFTLVGDGPEAARLRRRAPVNVRFAGRLPAADVAEHYRHAAVSAVPSLWPELFGLTALEALAHGVPVVASAVGGLPEVVEHEQTGLLVPPGDAGALAGAVARLATDPELAKRLGADGRRRAAERHDRGRYLTALVGHLEAAQAR